MIPPKRIDEIIRLNCELLGIDCPDHVLVPPAELPTATTVAAVGNSNRTIALNSELYPSMNERDVWLYLSHECRHLWQLRNVCSMLQGYRASSDLPLSDYASQIPEMDANAWATAVCRSVLGMEPIFNSYPPTVQAVIRSMAEELEDEYF